jgi:hypothetical protein
VLSAITVHRRRALRPHLRQGVILRAGRVSPRARAHGISWNGLLLTATKVMTDAVAYLHDQGIVHRGASTETA